MDKPPYRIPTMAEIRAVPDNGLSVVSTFTGAGGSCLGFRWAGFRTVWASEFVEAARETYAANFPDVPLDPRDVRLVSGDDVRAASGLDEFDVLEGSPPCASFSVSGKREEHWGQVRPYSDVEQRTDDLFFEYARLLGELRPRAFVAENVPGMTFGKAKGYFRAVKAALTEAGYRIGARILDAQWLGVPQRRKRLIIVGFRRDLGKEPVFPDPLPYRYSIRDALPELLGVVHVGGWGEGTYDPSDRPASTFMAEGYGGNNKLHIRVLAGGRHSMVHPDAPAPSTEELEAAALEGWTYEDGDWRPPRIVHDTSGEQSMGELDPDEPSPTITVGVGGLNANHFRVEPRISARTAGGFARQTMDPDQPAPTITQSGEQMRAEVAYEADREVPYADRDPSEGIMGYAIGEEWRRLRPGETSERFTNLVRAHPDEPSPTVTQTGGIPAAAGVTHPTEPRKFRIDELRRLCGFPEDFVLTGSYRRQWERLGRAVPPPMMRAVAERIADALG